MVCGPGLYVPTHAKKLAALQSYIRIAKYLVPTDPSITASHLWHDDLHDENIFVDAKNHSKITGVIDRRSVQVTPLSDHVLDPSFLDYDGPSIEGLEHPKLPDNIKDLSKEEQAELQQRGYTATRLYINASMLAAWRRLVHGKNPTVYRAISRFTSHSSYRSTWWRERRERR